VITNVHENAFGHLNFMDKLKELHGI